MRDTVAYRPMVKSAAPVNQLFCSLDIFNRGRQLNHALSIALHTILADTDTFRYRLAFNSFSVSQLFIEMKNK